MSGSTTPTLHAQSILLPTGLSGGVRCSYCYYLKSGNVSLSRAHSGLGGGLAGVHCPVVLLRDGLIALPDGGAGFPAPGPAVRLDSLRHGLLVRLRVLHLLGHVFTLPGIRKSVKRPLNLFIPLYIHLHFLY